MLGSLARFLLIAAFLIAQTAGLAHQAWHDAGAAVAHAATDGVGDGKAPKKSPLCDFHAALGTVLGALSCGASSAQAVAAAEVPFIAADLRAARFTSLTPRSRAPPTLL
jgi:hypothetical protein